MARKTPLISIERQRIPLLRQGIPIKIEALKDKETRREFLLRYGKVLCGKGFQLPKVY